AASGLPARATAGGAAAADTEPAKGRTKRIPHDNRWGSRKRILGVLQILLASTAWEFLIRARSACRPSLEQAAYLSPRLGGRLPLAGTGAPTVRQSALAQSW